MYAMVSSENNHMMELVQYRKRLGPKVDSRDTLDSTGTYIYFSSSIIIDFVLLKSFRSRN